jgi:hypothetical protein
LPGLRGCPRPARRAVGHVHRDAVAVPQHTQLFERLAAFQRSRRQRRESGAGRLRGRRTGRHDATALGWAAGQSVGDVPSRQCGIEARLKYSAICRPRPAPPSPHWGCANSASLSMACAAVLMHAVGLRGQHCGRAGRPGRVDQRLVALHVDHQVVAGSPKQATQASARRSLPLAWSARVSRACTCHARGRRPRCARSSAATTTRMRPIATRAAPRAPPSAGRRCRPAACWAGASRPAGPGSGREAWCACLHQWCAFGQLGQLIIAERAGL